MNDEKLQSDFIELIEENKKLIYKISHMYCDKVVDKKDLFQEIICNLWVSYPNFQSRSKISTWIYRIALNTAITWLRDYSKQPVKIEYTSLIPHLIDDNDDSTDELYKQLYEAINTLGKIDKALILLLLDDYSYNEIAEIVGLTTTNVATKISRVKLKLKQTLVNN